MIYTLTFNPSLDYIIRTKDFKTGTINRCEYEEILPGGKGINVSIVLKNLGLDSVALGFIAGFTGDQILKLMEEHGCRTDFIRIEEGMSRINVKLKSQEETEINGLGPKITEMDVDTLFQSIDRLVKEDILVLAGSIPSGVNGDIYEQIARRLDNKGVRIVVDAMKDLLVNVLKYKPFLIKPNNHELGDIFGVTLTSKKDVIVYGKKLQEMGARNVLVSMAGEGAILLDENGNVYERNAPKGTVINSVGAGDSMVAGFLYGYLLKGDMRTAFLTGIAAGSASAFSEQLADKVRVNDILKSL